MATTISEFVAVVQWLISCLLNGSYDPFQCVDHLLNNICDPLDLTGVNNFVVADVQEDCLAWVPLPYEQCLRLCVLRQPEGVKGHEKPRIVRRGTSTFVRLAPAKIVLSIEDLPPNFVAYVVIVDHATAPGGNNARVYLFRAGDRSRLELILNTMYHLHILVMDTHTGIFYDDAFQKPLTFTAVFRDWQTRTKKRSSPDSDSFDDDSNEPSCTEPVSFQQADDVTANDGANDDDDDNDNILFTPSAPKRLCLQQPRLGDTVFSLPSQLGGFSLPLQQQPASQPLADLLPEIQGLVASSDPSGDRQTDESDLGIAQNASAGHSSSCNCHVCLSALPSTQDQQVEETNPFVAQDASTGHSSSCPCSACLPVPQPAQPQQGGGVADTLVAQDASPGHSSSCTCKVCVPPDEHQQGSDDFQTEQQLTEDNDPFDDYEIPWQLGFFLGSP